MKTIKVYRVKFLRSWDEVFGPCSEMTVYAESAADARETAEIAMPDNKVTAVSATGAYYEEV